MRLVIIGYGRMGRLVDELSTSYDFEVVERLDIHNNAAGEGITKGRLPEVDVAVDFSTKDAVEVNLPRLATLGINAVVGTTGWHDREESLKKVVTEAGVGVVAAANFSLGVNLFLAIVSRASGLFADQSEYDAWLHEAHHAAKLDAPSGTARTLLRRMEQAGFGRTIDVASTRAGSIPGTHSVGFDGPFESVTLTHTARDRATFAHGALVAARWIQGKRGWFTMSDVLGIRA